MKTLTLTSEFFQNEFAESFCKAIQGNIDIESMEFVASKSDGRRFVFYDDVDMRCVLAHGVAFKLDDSFSVDWACLLGQNIKVYSTDDVGGGYVTNMRQYDSIRYASNLKLALSYLATLQGVIIEEAGE